jgi:outer membrane protein TolC
MVLRRCVVKRIILFSLFVIIVPLSLRGQVRTELSLKNAVDRALANNPVLGISREAVGVQKAEFWRSIAPPPPTVSVNYGFVPWGQKLDAFSERTVEVSQTIDFPTTIFLRGSQASHQISVAEEEYASARNEMLARTTIAYFNVLAKSERLELAKENRSVAEDFAQKSAIRRHVGEGTNLEQLTANVQYVQAKNAVETALNDLHVAKSELGTLIGLTREADLAGLFLTDSLVFRPPAANLERLIEVAQISNAQIRAKMFRRDAASTGRTLAWSSLLPTFSASYLRQTRDGITGLYGASFGISVPLWFMFDQRGQIESASAALAMVDHELEATRQSVIGAVRGAYFEKVNCEEQLRSFETDMLTQAREILRSAKASYEAGEISYLEFLQARQTVVQARTNYIDVLLAYRVAVARLEQAVGSPLN